MDGNRTLEESIATDVQKILNQDPDSPFGDEEQDTEDNELEQLSEDLIRVFSYDNIENSTNSQKEKLIQRIIKIGGKDYTAEDLRRDILKIEVEDNTWKQIRQQGIGSREDQEQFNISLDQRNNLK